MTFIILALLLVGCGTGNHALVTPELMTSKPRVFTQLMAAQCRVFERAFKQTERQTGQKRYSIVENCPHYKDVKVIHNQFTEAGLFLSAAGMTTPIHVQKSGAAGVRLFQAMLSRGVSVKIAAEVARSPEFKVAVNVAHF